MTVALTESKALLVLDLDETLVHTVEEPLAGLEPDLYVGEYLVYKRPHVDTFLTRASLLYNLAIWSKFGTGYVVPTVRELLKPHPAPLFVWSFPRCTRRFNHDDHAVYHIKDLKKVRKQGFSKERTLIVNDDPRNAERSFGIAIPIEPFNGEKDDRKLLHLADYLESLAIAPNFRTIEKRYWRKQFVR